MTITQSALVFRDLFYRLCRGINSIGVILLMGMMLLIVADVFMRRVFSRPFMGAFEIVQFILVILVYFSLPYTTIKKTHISVELIVTKFSKRIQLFIESLTLFLSLGLFILITWRNIIKARQVWAENGISVLLSVPLFPFYYILAFGCLLISMALFIHLTEALAKLCRSFNKTYLVAAYILVCTVLYIVIAMSGHWFEPEMSPNLIGILGILVLFVLMAANMPIAFCMGLVGLLGYCLLVGTDAGLSQLENVPFNVGSDYILSVLPLFLLMGQFAFYSGLSHDLYDAFYKWLGHYPGGLAMATVGGCAAFAAVCGSSVATTATMGTVALPGMRKYRYSEKLALGSIAAGGTVGILIPPSIVFILYGILTEQSIGKLFLAGFIPGVLAVLFYLSAIVLQVRINPSLGPAGPKTPFSLKIKALRHTWGMIALFALVMGGIYLGFFTPTEAGAVGAFGAFLMALFKNRLTKEILYDCLLETGRTTAMLIIIFVGAMMFNYFLAITNLPMDIAQMVVDQGFNRYMVMVSILIIYLLLGCIMDAGSMIILTIPIVFPLIQSLAFDPIWFGVIIVMVAEIGAITPPVGLNVFVVKGIARDVPISEIFKGILPFWAVDMVRLFVLVTIPQISLFLPNVMKAS